MKHLKTDRVELHLGLEKPIKILHITDIHISFADDRDEEKWLEFAAHRREIFFKEGRRPERDPAGYLIEAMEYAKEFDCTVITGDLIDFNSYANYDAATEILAGKDYMFTPGSHEFCPNNFERKAERWDEMQQLFRGDMEFESRLVGGVNVITMDNSYYVWTQKQFDMLKAEVSRGYPILLFSHVPYDCPFLTHEQTGIVPPEGAKELTVEMNEYIKNQPLIKGIFTGHYHRLEYVQSGYKPHPCYIGPSLFTGCVGVITID